MPTVLQPFSTLLRRGCLLVGGALALVLVCDVGSVLSLGLVQAEEPDDRIVVKSAELPELPLPLTSFGAVIANNHLYVCGGHMGDAHDYSRKLQSDEMLVLDLSSPQEWKKVDMGENLQGLGLVAYKDQVIRVGGFAARNDDGEPQKLESVDQVACFEIKIGTWRNWPSLPKPRSSHDAVVVGNKLYVVGGWMLDPNGGDTVWHKDMDVLNLDHPDMGWTTLEVPFQRRALATVDLDGKLYAIGGMKPSGVTTDVSIFDPKTGEWSDGPAVPGEGMEGFGIAAAILDGQLVATTSAGHAVRLNAKSKQWEAVGSTPTARFFHRLLPQNRALLVVGGVNMGVGKFQNIESLTFKP